MAARTGDQTHWAEYRKLRNEVVKRQRIEKVSWEEDKLNHLRHGPTKLWRNLKAWLSWSKGGPPTQLNSTNQHISREIINRPCLLPADKHIIKPKNVLLNMTLQAKKKWLQLLTKAKALYKEFQTEQDNKQHKITKWYR